MRRHVWMIAALVLSAQVARGDDKLNADQLRKAYDDSLVQLKAAQNSKNDLAAQNEKLGRQVQDLQKKLTQSQTRVQALERQVAENDERTYAVRSLNAAWRSWLGAHPDLERRWKLFLREDALAFPDESRPVIDLFRPAPDRRTLSDRD